MKRRATSQLTRDGNYEDAQPDEYVDVEVSTPAQIAQRKFYRAKRPVRAEPVSEEKKGFKLAVPLLTKDMEQILLSKPPTVDFSVLNEEIKEASPEKKARTSSGFKSAGFSDLIADINKKKSDQVEANFLTSATPKSKIASVVNFPSVNATAQAPKLYQSVASFECSIAVNKSDKGKGRLEFMLNIADKPVSLVVFRNSIGSVLYQGYLSKTVSITEATDVTIESEGDSGDAEYSIPTYRMTDKILKEEMRVCLPPQKLDALQSALKKVREELTK